MDYFSPMMHSMQSKYDDTYKDIRMVFDRMIFLRYLGIIFKMSLYNIPNFRRYWECSDFDGVDFGISKFMGRTRF